jgi:hypothetical protein
MKERHSENRERRGGKYRVYRLPEDVRQVISNRPSRQTIRQFIEESIERWLPPLVDSLTSLGLRKPHATRPSRLPMAKETLAKLSDASEQTGVPASRLLLAVLANKPKVAVDRKRVPRRTAQSADRKQAGAKVSKRKAAETTQGRKTRRRTVAPSEGKESLPTPTPAAQGDLPTEAR